MNDGAARGVNKGLARGGASVHARAAAHQWQSTCLNGDVHQDADEDEAATGPLAERKPVGWVTEH